MQAFIIAALVAVAHASTNTADSNSKPAAPSPQTYMVNGKPVVPQYVEDSSAPYCDEVIPNFVAPHNNSTSNGTTTGPVYTPPEDNGASGTTSTSDASAVAVGSLSAASLVLASFFFA